MSPLAPSPEAEMPFQPHFIDVQTALAAELDELRDKCGVFGVIVPEGAGGVAKLTLIGADNVQHRGYDAAGAYLYGSDGFVGHKGLGRVDQVFPHGEAVLHDKAPDAAIGLAHVRWGTTEGLSVAENERSILPWIGPDGQFGLSHNGDVKNAFDVAGSYGIEPKECPSDSVAIAKIIHKRLTETDDIIAVLQEVLPQLQGSYSLIMSDGTQLIAARDPNMIRPLCIGQLPAGGYAVASETVALDAVGAMWLRDVEPGEIVVMDQAVIEQGPRSFRLGTPAQNRFCGLEVPYLMNEDSRLGPVRLTVGEMRQRLGEHLAEEFPVDNPEEYLVVGMPASGITPGIAYARKLGIRYEQLYEKVLDERSFLQPDQASRQQMNRRKIDFDPAKIAGKKLINVDDSTVRGNAALVLNERLWEAGAQEVHWRFVFPVIRKGCHLGVATAREEELLSYGRDQEAMRQFTRSTTMEFMSVEGFKGVLEPLIGRMCLGCLGEGEEFPVPNPTRRGRRLLPLVEVS